MATARVFTGIGVVGAAGGNALGGSCARTKQSLWDQCGTPALPLRDFSGLARGRHWRCSDHIRGELKEPIFSADWYRLHRDWRCLRD